MRRNAAVYVMLAAEAGVLALVAALHVSARPWLLRAFGDYGTTLPRAAAIALSAWFLPGAAGAAVLASALALALPLRRSRRASLVGAGLVVVCGAFIVAVLAFLAAAFDPG